MASPSETPKKGVKCDGIIKKGARKGQVCGKLLLAKDSPQENPSIVCSRPQCGGHHSILALLRKALKIWGEPLRKAALAVLTEKIQEKRSQEMDNNKIIKKRTIVMLGQILLSEVEGELLPFTVGEIITQRMGHVGYPSKRTIEVTKIRTDWAEYPKKGITLTRTIVTENAYS